jgi:hypothetical protein
VPASYDGLRALAAWADMIPDAALSPARKARLAFGLLGLLPLFGLTRHCTLMRPGAAAPTFTPLSRFAPVRGLLIWAAAARVFDLDQSDRICPGGIVSLDRLQPGYPLPDSDKFFLTCDIRHRHLRPLASKAVRAVKPGILRLRYVSERAHQSIGVSRPR